MAIDLESAVIHIANCLTEVQCTHGILLFKMELEETDGGSDSRGVSVEQCKDLAKKYCNMGEWQKLSANERQNLFDDHNTWNLGRKNNSDNGCQTDANKSKMNRQIKQHQASLDASKNHIASFPDTATYPYENSVGPSYLIKGIKYKNQKLKSE